MAKIIECENSAVPLDLILSQHAFDLENILAMDPSFLKLEEEHDHSHHDHDHDHHHHHDPDDCSKCAAGDKEHHDHDHDHKHDEHCGHKPKHHHDTRVSSVGIEMDGTLIFLNNAPFITAIF